MKIKCPKLLYRSKYNTYDNLFYLTRYHKMTNVKIFKNIKKLHVYQKKFFQDNSMIWV